MNRIVVHGRHLVFDDPNRGNHTTGPPRFRIRGMAFPVPLHYHDSYYQYDAQGWIAVLKQLREASPYLNTLRLYRLPPTMSVTSRSSNKKPTSTNMTSSFNSAISQHDFFQAAADLGFYLIVPLTDVSGAGVLDRDLAAPKCYPSHLYHYGTSVLDSLRGYPNILGAVIGNEVMNSLEHWHSAPCLLAYARDLKRYMQSKGMKIPLIYTAQHDGIGASVSPAQQIQLTTNYLTCTEGDGDTSTNSSTNNQTIWTKPAIDMIGINIESWCSSLQTFDKNEDGSLGTFKDLYQQLSAASEVPIFFSELGCSQYLFDRDNGMRKYPLAPSLGARTWNELSVVEHDMDDLWSGYVAYAYDGPYGFSMTTGGPWLGTKVLTFNQDMDNFLSQLDTVALSTSSGPDNASHNVNDTWSSCSMARQSLGKCCNLNLHTLRDMPSFYDTFDWFSLDNWKEWFEHLFFRGKGESPGIHAPAAIVVPSDGRFGTEIVSGTVPIIPVVMLGFVVLTYAWYTKRNWKQPLRLAEYNEKENLLVLARDGGQTKNYFTFA